VHDGKKKKQNYKIIYNCWWRGRHYLELTVAGEKDAVDNEKKMRGLLVVVDC
jgi:hypothetical protein